MLSGRTCSVSGRVSRAGRRAKTRAGPPRSGRSERRDLPDEHPQHEPRRADARVPLRREDHRHRPQAGPSTPGGGRDRQEDQGRVSSRQRSVSVNRLR